MSYVVERFGGGRARVTLDASGATRALLAQSPSDVSPFPRPPMLQRDELERWLDELGYEYEVEEGLDGEEGIAWAVAYHPRNLFQGIALQQGDGYNDVNLQIGISVAEEHRATLEALDEQTRIRFLYDLRLALIERPSFFRIELVEGDGELPERLIAMQRLVDDEVTKARFFEAHAQVQATGLVFVTMLRKLHSLKGW